MVFATLDSLHEELLAKEPSDFVSHYLFDCVPFLFGDNTSGWIEWKTALAKMLDVDAHEVVLTGSAAIGFSLNPKKDFRPFTEKSDIDCGIISQHYFDIAWRHLRLLRPSFERLSSEGKRAIAMHQKNYVFAGTIATDFILPVLPFAKAWQSAREQMSHHFITQGREVNFRIYKDYDSLRHYQANGIKRLRADLVEAATKENIADEAIPTEGAEDGAN